MHEVKCTADAVLERGVTLVHVQAYVRVRMRVSVRVWVHSPTIRHACVCSPSLWGSPASIPLTTTSKTNQFRRGTHGIGAAAPLGQRGQQDNLTGWLKHKHLDSDTGMYFWKKVHEA